MTDVIFQSTLSCPGCGHATIETMPTDACVWFHECECCHMLIRPKRGDCCVFCSYGTMACPPVQAARQGLDPCCSRPS